MLNENQLYNNKLKFLELLGKLNVDLTQLVKYLDTHDYFNKPASSQYFRPYAGTGTAEWMDEKRWPQYD